MGVKETKIKQLYVSVGDDQFIPPKVLILGKEKVKDVFQQFSQENLFYDFSFYRRDHIIAFSFSRKSIIMFEIGDSKSYINFKNKGSFIMKDCQIEVDQYSQIWLNQSPEYKMIKLNHHSLTWNLIFQLNIKGYTDPNYYQTLLDRRYNLFVVFNQKEVTFMNTRQRKIMFKPSVIFQEDFLSYPGSLGNVCVDKGKSLFFYCTGVSRSQPKTFDPKQRKTSVHKDHKNKNCECYCMCSMEPGFAFCVGVNYSLTNKILCECYMYKVDKSLQKHKESRISLSYPKELITLLNPKYLARYKIIIGVDYRGNGIFLFKEGLEKFYLMAKFGKKAIPYSFMAYCEEKQILLSNFKHPKKTCIQKLVQYLDSQYQLCQ